MSDLKLMAYGDYRCRLDDDNMLVIHVGSNDEIMDSVTATATMDGTEVPVAIVKRNTIRAKLCYKAVDKRFNCEYQFCIKVTDRFKEVKLKLTFGERFDNTVNVIKIDGGRYRKNCKKVPCSVDMYEKSDKGVMISGWVASDRDVTICPMVKGKKIQHKVGITFRKDIVDYYQEDECNKPSGFEIIIPDTNIRKISIKFSDGIRETVRKIDVTKDWQKKGHSLTSIIDRTKAYLRKYGLGRTVYKCICKVLGRNSFNYNKWVAEHEPNEKELIRQKKFKFAYQPKFSVIVPVYRPEEKFFVEMVESVINQTYSNWELCLADGGGDGHTVEKIINTKFKDNRIKYVKLNENKGISGNTNAALALADGDYIVLGDHDDIIRPNALFECAKAINENRDIDVIYSDEDKVMSNGKKRLEPNLKPDFNLELLRSVNYICHLFVFSRRLYEKVGNFNSEYDGAQDHDMILRCVENTDNIKHIPKILYSWRIHQNSTSVNPESKMYAYIAGANAVKAHLERLGIKAEVEINRKMLGIYQVIYKLETEPMVSILIPNKDHKEDLDKCIKSIEKQDYSNYEIIVIENNSTEDETFEYYKTAEKSNSKIHVVYWKEDFNYSKINNFGATFAKGEYFLLLNNDTEMIENNCLRSLVSYGIGENTGIVGAKLLYDDDTVQHAGVIVGLGGVACHILIGNHKDDPGYQAYANVAREYTAVTAACLLVKREAFEAVGGLEEQLKVAFNDIDFCLKVREKGYRVIYNPYALLYHYESKSRGYEDTPEKIERFQGESLYLVEKWSKIMDEGDPHYNPNLSLSTTDFSIREN